MDSTVQHIDLMEPISERAAAQILMDEELSKDCIKRGVDLGMLVNNLKLNVSQRIEQLQELLTVQREIREAKWEPEHTR